MTCTCRCRWLAHTDVVAGIGVVNVRGRVAVMQESVSVSTVSSCDASTQTLTHAETQTDQSTVSCVHTCSTSEIALV